MFMKSLIIAGALLLSTGAAMADCDLAAPDAAAAGQCVLHGGDDEEAGWSYEVIAGVLEQRAVQLLRRGRASPVPARDVIHVRTQDARAEGGRRIGGAQR